MISSAVDRFLRGLDACQLPQIRHLAAASLALMGNASAQELGCRAGRTETLSITKGLGVAQTEAKGTPDEREEPAATARSLHWCFLKWCFLKSVYKGGSEGADRTLMTMA
jgi:hypothetical protein